MTWTMLGNTRLDYAGKYTQQMRERTLQRVIACAPEQYTQQMRERELYRGCN
jgi:hypothetical protein